MNYNDKRKDNNNRNSAIVPSKQEQLSPEEIEHRRQIMAQQYEAKLAKDNHRGVSKEGLIEAKLREAKLKKVQEFEKNNPNNKANMDYRFN